MTIQRDQAGFQRRCKNLTDLLANISYEVMPFKNTEQDVVENVPTTVPLTVTVTEAKGIDPTLALTERLAAQGYSAAPHLPARQFLARGQVVDVVDRLSEAGVRSVFVVGGDAPHPAGPFEHALGLLKVMTDIGHPFTEVGIGGYPEGHAAIPAETLNLALEQKAPMATRIITQICFHADTTVTWTADVAKSGIDLPVYVGMPGPINRQKLMRISAGIGLGQSARFLQKQSSLLWRFLLPGAYNPTKLAKRLGSAARKASANIGGLHIFTFNELQKTELWRRQLLASVAEKQGR